MDMPSKFFKVSRDRTKYELKYVANRSSAIGPVMILSKRADGRKRLWSDSSGIGNSPVPYNEDDYLEDFKKKFRELQAGSETEEYLGVHFRHFMEYSGLKGRVFLDKIEYGVLHDLEKQKSPHVKPLTRWINNQRKMDLMNEEQRKVEYLKYAFEVAREYSPSNPYSVSLKPLELGFSKGFAKDEITRIVVELRDDDLVQSTLGMKALFVTQKAKRFLTHLERSNEAGGFGVPYINNSINIGGKVHAGNFMAHSTQSTQDASQVTVTNQQISEFISELRAKADSLPLSKEDIADIKEDVEAIKGQLAKPAPKEFKVQNHLRSILSYLSSIPKEALAALLSDKAVEIFNTLSASHPG